MPRCGRGPRRGRAEGSRARRAGAPRPGPAPGRRVTCRESRPELLDRQDRAVAVVVPADREVLDALRSALQRPGDGRRDADGVHRPDLDDVVVELDAARSGEDHVDLLGLVVPVGDGLAAARLDGHEADPGLHGIQVALGEPHHLRRVDAGVRCGVPDVAEVLDGVDDDPFRWVTFEAELLDPGRLGRRGEYDVHEPEPGGGAGRAACRTWLTHARSRLSCSTSTAPSSTCRAAWSAPSHPSWKARATRASRTTS